jgi:hypothetical protein
MLHNIKSSFFLLNWLFNSRWQYGIVESLYFCVLAQLTIKVFFCSECVTICSSVERKYSLISLVLYAIEGKS